MKKISILGSTGSIGKQALEVVKALKDKIEVYALSAGSNIAVLREQIAEFHPQIVSIKDETLYKVLKQEYPDTKILCGDKALEEIAGDKNNDMVLVSVTGLSGLRPTLAAIDNNIDVALANKETLVAAGNVVMQKVKESQSRIIPVDSEHSAIFQCLDKKNYSEIKKLIVTASGGPFRTASYDQIQSATVEQTLDHPNWSMGNKITIDSATLMNKGLEVIEAHWLFDIDYKNIEVVIHPQSIIHSAVEFIDGSTLAQMGLPSMHIPIQYAMTYPERVKGIASGSMNFFEVANLEFYKPDMEKFPCLKLAYDAGVKGGSCPVVLNAVNEEAVYAFLNRKIGLMDIPKLVESVLSKHECIYNPSLDEIIDIDKQSRIYAKELF